MKNITQLNTPNAFAVLQTHYHTVEEMYPPCFGFFFFSSYRLQEGLRLVKAIKLFVFHHQEMSSIDDYSLQADE